MDKNTNRRNITTAFKDSITSHYTRERFTTHNELLEEASKDLIEKVNTTIKEVWTSTTMKYREPYSKNPKIYHVDRETGAFTEAQNGKL